MKISMRLILAITLLSSSMLASEQVLCYGADGSVLIEKSINGKCQDSFHADCCNVTSDHCSPCKDIELRPVSEAFIGHENELELDIPEIKSVRFDRPFRGHTKSQLSSQAFKKPFLSNVLRI